MTEILISKFRRTMTAVDFKPTLLIVVLTLSMTFISHAQAQTTTCDNYRDILEDQVIKIFTSPEEADYRQAASFPNDLLQVSESDIQRLNLPQEQSICNSIFATLNDGNPLPGPPFYRAVWKIKDYYLMVTSKYYFDSMGKERAEEPTVGGIYNDDYELLVLIPNM